MVPIKREPLTAFVSDTVALYSWLLSAIRFYIQPYSRKESIGTRRGVKRSLYRVFHKDSMKIVQDFIIEEMSVNKNEYVVPFFFSSFPLLVCPFFPSIVLTQMPLDSQWFKSVISRRKHKSPATIAKFLQVQDIYFAHFPLSQDSLISPLFIFPFFLLSYFLVIPLRIYGQYIERGHWFLEVILSRSLKSKIYLNLLILDYGELFKLSRCYSTSLHFIVWKENISIDCSAVVPTGVFTFFKKFTYGRLEGKCHFSFTVLL